MSEDGEISETCESDLILQVGENEELQMDITEIDINVTETSPIQSPLPSSHIMNPILASSPTVLTPHTQSHSLALLSPPITPEDQQMETPLPTEPLTRERPVWTPVQFPTPSLSQFSYTPPIRFPTSSPDSSLLPARLSFDDVWSTFLNKLQVDVEATLNLCRTGDFLSMTDNSLKMMVLSSIRRLLETEHRPYFENGDQLNLEQCVQSERAIIMETGSIGYIDILILPPTGRCFIPEGDAPISANEVKDIRDEECLVIKVKYCPMTRLYEWDEWGTTLLPLAKTKRKDAIKKRVRIDRASQFLKEKFFFTDELYAEIKVNEEVQKVHVTELLTMVLDQAKKRARALPVAKDTKVLATALLAYGSKVVITPAKMIIKN